MTEPTTREQNLFDVVDDCNMQLDIIASGKALRPTLTALREVSRVSALLVPKTDDELTEVAMLIKRLRDIRATWNEVHQDG